MVLLNDELGRVVEAWKKRLVKCIECKRDINSDYLVSFIQFHAFFAFRYLFRFELLLLYN